MLIIKNNKTKLGKEPDECIAQKSEILKMKIAKGKNF